MSPRSFVTLEKELVSLLSERFGGIGVQIEHSARWNRPCVTFRWKGFASLVPEERFHRLVTVIPADVREEKMANFVWLELAENETVEDFLKLPRSEDIASDEREIYIDLRRIRLFDVLAKALGTPPEKRCDSDYREMIRILKANGFSDQGVERAKLLMIRHHAFCDCQIIQTASEELAQLFADAA